VVREWGRCKRLLHRRTRVLKLISCEEDEEWVMGNESVVPFWAGKELRWEIVED